MAIQISGCTVIDNSRNVTNANNMCVGSITMTGSNGNVCTPGTVTAANFVADTPPEPIFFSPSDGASNVIVDSNIYITFDQVVSKGTGNIRIRSGSAAGTIQQTISVTSGAVTITNGSIVEINPSLNLLYFTNTYVVVDAGAFENSSGTGNEIINTYNFTTRAVALGESYEGGYLICQAGGTRWIVAPSTSEVSRSWHSRNDATTTAQSVSGCTGWFVPTLGQLQNPGYTCRTYWDSYSPALYWSSTVANPIYSYRVCFNDGGFYSSHKALTSCVRAFRCVSY
jgi:hypothetical protein